MCVHHFLVINTAVITFNIPPKHLCCKKGLGSKVARNVCWYC